MSIIGICTLALMVSATPASALSCKYPEWFFGPPPPKQYSEDNFIHRITQAHRDLEAGEFLVWGRFSKLGEGRFTHEIEKHARSDRWRDPGRASDEIQADVIYKYVRAVRFDGLRLKHGKAERFSTEKTVINLPMQRQGIGNMPDFETQVFGKMKESHAFAGWFEVDADLCPSYFQLSKDQFAKLQICLVDPACGGFD